MKTLPDNIYNVPPKEIDYYVGVDGNSSSRELLIELQFKSNNTTICQALTFKQARAIARELIEFLLPSDEDIKKAIEELKK